MSISVMPADLVAQIKAGEVIERPASVVKELLENSIDAGATRIRVEIADGGKRLIRVVDDGAGIASDELVLAFGEHTSSKLTTTESLGHISSLGFRGEALHAIANSAQVEAISGLRLAGVAGSVVFDHGSLVEQSPAAPAGGTRIAVHDLFARVPARRKHLRSHRSEAFAVHQIVAQYGICCPCVAISLVTDGKPVLMTPGGGRVEEAFAAVYGAGLLDTMIPIESDGPVRISGIVSPPGLSRPNRQAIHVFVNGRPVKSAALTFAVEEPYGEELRLNGRHPLAAVSISVPPEEIDPNVHPAKLEVRLLAERAVFAAVRKAVVAGLESLGPVREPAKTSLDGMNGQYPWSGTPDPATIPDRLPYPDQLSFPQRPYLPAAPPLSEALQVLRVFGQSGKTFIIAEGPMGLYMIDQHAAHERILFDELSRRQGKAPMQRVLEPVPVELTASQLSTLESSGDRLAVIGFDVEPFDEGRCMVRAVPMAGRDPVGPDVVVELLDALSEASAPDDVVARALTIVACKAAIKAGQELTLAEMRELVDQLERTDHPRTCPHGRPTTIHISTERMEREFGRR